MAWKWADLLQYTEVSVVILFYYTFHIMNNIVPHRVSVNHICYHNDF